MLLRISVTYLISFKEYNLWIHQIRGGKAIGTCVKVADSQPKFVVRKLNHQTMMNKQPRYLVGKRAILTWRQLAGSSHFPVISYEDVGSLQCSNSLARTLYLKT